MRYKWFLAAGVGLVFSLILQGTAVHAQKTGHTLSLIYGNNINGEIDPCPT